MNLQTTAAAATTDPDRATVECLVLDSCHALEAYLAHPCERYAEELLHLQTCLMAAAGSATDPHCDDVLGLVAEIERALAQPASPQDARGAA